MSTGSGTTRRVLRSLDHLRADTRNKFIRKVRPSYYQKTAVWVAPKDRVTFWNIVPGDAVKLRTGAVAHDDNGKPVRGEGIVTSIDRTTNRLWLRDAKDDVNLAPKNVKHTVPRLIDPDAGPDKGFSGNTSLVPRPVHYSKVMLKLPDSDEYASRIIRSKPFFDKRKNMFCFNRFAIVKARTEEALRSGDAVRKVHVPWPKLPERKRPFGPTLADHNTVMKETWAPWIPEDPVLLPAPRMRTTPASEAIAAERYMHWEAQRVKAAAKHDTSTLQAPSLAHTYEGFKVKDSVRPPPVAQAPMPAERINIERERLARFVADPDTQEHIAKGGQVFAASDYLDAAPLFGLAANEDPVGLAKDKSDLARDDEGRLVGRLGKADADSMPIELLMTDELANMRGRKWRMRHWKQTKEVTGEADAVDAAEHGDLLKELDVLRI